MLVYPKSGGDGIADAVILMGKGSVVVVSVASRTEGEEVVIDPRD